MRAWIACLVLLCGCGDGSRRADAGAELDASEGSDLGTTPDAATITDASRDARRGPRLNHDATCPPPDPPGTNDAGEAWAQLLRPGRYGVGVTTLMVTDATRDRVLPVDVWYPTEPGTTSGSANVYFLDTSLGTLAHLCSPARRDAAPAGPTSTSAGGPFPLVLFSHGFGGVRFQSVFLTEHLASHGYVVAAPDHVGNTFADLGALGDDEAAAQSAIDRPLDMIAVLDRMLEPGVVPGLAVDPTRVAITGHSFGAWTCFETARRDARIRVVIPMAPGFREPSSPAIAAELARPLMIFGGTADHTTPIDEGARPAYDAASPPKALVTLIGAGHLDFSDLCQIEALRGIVDDGCDPAVLDPAIVRDRVNVLTLAFLGRYLNDERSYDGYLEPSAVLLLDHLEYERAP